MHLCRWLTIRRPVESRLEVSSAPFTLAAAWLVKPLTLLLLLWCTCCRCWHALRCKGACSVAESALATWLDLTCRHGRGRFNAGNARYDGEWAEDLKHGVGASLTECGDKYKGVGGRERSALCCHACCLLLWTSKHTIICALAVARCDEHVYATGVNWHFANDRMTCPQASSRQASVMARACVCMWTAASTKVGRQRCACSPGRHAARCD